MNIANRKGSRKKKNGDDCFTERNPRCPAGVGSLDSGGTTRLCDAPAAVHAAPSAATHERWYDRSRGRVAWRAPSPRASTAQAADIATATQRNVAACSRAIQKCRPAPPAQSARWRGTARHSRLLRIKPKITRPAARQYCRALVEDARVGSPR